VNEEEFTTEVQFPSSHEYYKSVMDMAAPIQNLFAKFSDHQKREVEQKIIAGADAHRRGGVIPLAIAVRFVMARKSL
jgi:hypothetical protein